MRVKLKVDVGYPIMCLERLLYPTTRFGLDDAAGWTETRLGLYAPGELTDYFEIESALREFQDVQGSDLLEP